MGRTSPSSIVPYDWLLRGKGGRDKRDPVNSLRTYVGNVLVDVSIEEI